MDRDTYNLYGRRTRKRASKAASLLILSLCCLVCSLLIPLFLVGSVFTTAAAWIVILIYAAILVLTAKRIFILILFALSFFSALSVTGSPLLLALILNLIIPSGILATVFSAAKKKMLLIPFLFFPLSFGVAFLLTRNPIAALGGCVSLFPGAILGLFRRKKGNLTPALVCASLPIILGAISLATLAIYVIFGGLNQASLALAVKQATESLAKMLGNAFASVGMQINTATENLLAAMSRSYMNMAFGLLVAAALIAVYGANYLQSRLLDILSLSEEDCKSMEHITVSVHAAILFILAYVLSFTTSPSGTEAFLAIAANNLNLILMPAMLLAGFDYLNTLPHRGPGGFLAFIGILFAAFLISSTYMTSFFTLLALVGSAAILLSATDKWAKEHYGKGENL